MKRWRLWMVSPYDPDTGDEKYAGPIVEAATEREAVARWRRENPGEDALWDAIWGEEVQHENP